MTRDQQTGYDRPPIDVPPQVPAFEVAYHLPPLHGASQRQEDYARITRHAVLHPLLTTLMDATASHPNPKAVYAIVDEMRRETSARVWINDHYPHRRNPLKHVLSLAS